jgi:inner membrane protein
MDTLTHGLFGALTAQLGFRQRIGRDASWVAGVTAILPDLDVFAVPLLSSGDEGAGFERLTVHRGVTHSLILIPFAAALIALLWWWVRKKVNRTPGNRPPPYLLLYFCVLIPLISQPLLDVCTSWGTQLFAPFNDARLAVDVLPIVDFIFSGLIVLSLLACFIVRKVKKNNSLRPSLVIGWCGFALVLAYVGAGFAMNGIVKRAVRDHFGGCAESNASAEYRAYPQLGTIFVWRVTRRCPDSWLAAKVNVLFGPDMNRVEYSIATNEDNEWIRRALELPEMKTYDWFAMGQLRATYSRRDGFHVAEFQDMRYGSSAAGLEGQWAARVTFDQSGNVVSVENRRGGGGHGGMNASSMLKQMWRDLTNP